MSDERIERELSILREGGQQAGLIFDGRRFVLYRDVPSGGARVDLPDVTDVIVPVPEGYPASVIDLAALPSDSRLLPRLKGGQNNQGTFDVCGRQWQLASYHPYSSGQGPQWDPIRHGFHTYYGHILSWLQDLA